jgi:hypothetical protein
MARHAFALAQLAERIELDQAAGLRPYSYPEPARLPFRVRFRSVRAIAARSWNSFFSPSAITGAGRADETEPD